MAFRADYLIRETGQNLFRNPSLSIATIGKRDALRTSTACDLNFGHIKCAASDCDRATVVVSECPRIF